LAPQTSAAMTAAPSIKLSHNSLLRIALKIN
jgi:hypothetical protein